jgi:Uma2 family endonuclease
VELIFGDIYMMAGASAEHQDVVGDIFFQLKSATQEETHCTPRIAPYDIKIDIDGNRSVVQPDVMLFCQDDALPCAIFEVLSPSTAYKDMTVKKELYERAGVREYFLVNIEHKVVEKFRLDGQAYVYDKTYGADEQMPVTCMQIEIEVETIFEHIKGETQA